MTVLLATLCDPAESQTLSVNDAYAWVSPGGRSAAAYFRLENQGSTGQMVTEAHSDIATSTMLHGHVIDESGTARMVGFDEGIAISAGTTVVFEPGGLHVMFMGLLEHPRTGDSIAFTLSLANGTTIDVRATVRMRGERPQAN